MKEKPSVRRFKRLLLSFVATAVVLGVVITVLITAFFSHEDIAPTLQAPESEVDRPVIELPSHESPVVTKDEAKQMRRPARSNERVFADGSVAHMEYDAMAARPALEESVAHAVSSSYAQKVTGSRMVRRALGVAGGSDRFSPAARADEELWIIAIPGRSDRETAAGEAGEDASPGTGSMHATYVPDDDESGGPQEVPLPLRHTAVQARITGYVSTVDVTQHFENPFETKIEAVYVFPLPEKAAVSEFVMTIGERRIRGILREREEAEEIYAEARSQGYQASLLVQHRPNIFEQKVANIEPGHRIDVSIRYFHTLAYRDGWYSFVFPTVVGPRYNPPGFPDPVSALQRTANPPAGIGVQYLPPLDRSGHDIAISLELDAGVAIEAIEASHGIDETRTAASTARIELLRHVMIPNRDFVLDFKVAGGRIKSNLLTYADPEKEAEGYFAMMLYPPEDRDDLSRAPLELVFVLDCSGSMEGEPIAQAKAAVLAALNRLQSDDTFQIIRFSNHANQFSHEPLPATRGNVDQGRRYVESLRTGGGTEMNAGVRAALNFPHDPRRLRFVTFMTDGYIGNEVEILREIHQSIGASRIFSFGVGSSVNRYLMERMASAGRGAAAFLGLQDSGSEVMNAFFDRVGHPALADVRIDWDGMQVSDVYPSRLPDLFVGRPVFVTGKYRGELGEPRVSGRAGGERIEFPLANESAGGDTEHSFLPKIWARQRIADLVDRRAWAADRFGERESLIKQTALAYGLMSDYTAFVAVDTLMPTPGDFGITVVQPVPVPAGVRYETTVPPRPRLAPLPSAESD